MTAFSRHDATDIVVAIDQVAFMWRGTAITVSLGGDFSVINAIAAITAAEVLGISVEQMKSGCSNVKAVPGRFEIVPNNAGIDVIVDFAHTPDGLDGLLRSVRELSDGNIFLVFGCGGERDLAKRPRMGEIAARLADEVIVTSDNPRGEIPETIISSIISGISEPATTVRAIVNRADAIESAITDARRGDIVVIAGKGHEKTQEINGVLTPFSDVEVARVALQNRKGD
jgi:UDP-N-acetylmuramoyl-L-alanyl-D-glutamate--2,6-diaminopimelate ligase